MTLVSLELVHLAIDVVLHVIARHSAEPFDNSRHYRLVVLLGVVKPELIADADADHEKDNVAHGGQRAEGEGHQQGSGIRGQEKNVASVHTADSDRHWPVLTPDP
jgi:hypothetical protein